MRNLKITKNPFLLFLPFLILYIIIVLIFPTNGNFGDENRYLMFAHHILNGYYSPPPPNIDLGNVPGFPLILALFVGLHLPLISITILNAFLFYFSIILLFKSLRLLVPFKIAFVVSLFWALFFNLYEYLPIIYTESLTAFLVTLLIFYSLKAFNSGQKKYLIFAGLSLGYLALTKAIFGYVMMFLFVSLFLLWIAKRKSVNYRKGMVILLFAFVVTLPYLIYSYHLTGKFFYWGSNGGNNLYWMSTPFQGEYGNWIEYPFTANQKRITGSKKILQENHEKDFIDVLKYPGVKKDEELKKLAIINIRSHPIKFLENCFSNAGRIVFNYPFSYQLEKPSKLFRLPLNGIIIVLSLFCLIATFLNWRKILFPVRFLLFFTFLYLGGSILGSAETRMFTMIVPVLLVWISYILDRTVKINFKLKEEQVNSLDHLKN
jgi:4-amino-4-deoxy-L-arabinose transferase-like glycosyltransferase